MHVQNAKKKNKQDQIRGTFAVHRKSWKACEKRKSEGRREKIRRKNVKGGVQEVSADHGAYLRLMKRRRGERRKIATLVGDERGSGLKKKRKRADSA